MRSRYRKSDGNVWLWLIDYPPQLGEDVKEVLEIALSRAEETLPDRRKFGLNAERWHAFQIALDAPPPPAPRLARLLREPGVFERR